jgi:hypothetical protein
MTNRIDGPNRRASSDARPNNPDLYLTGSRAIIKINDGIFGFAFKVDFNISTEQKEVTTVDDWTAYEYAPGRVRCNGTLSMFHVVGADAGVTKIQANVLSHLFHRYISIRVEDRQTGRRIFEAPKAVITSRSESISAGELTTTELQWKAISWIDESDPYYPRYYNLDPNLIASNNPFG